MDRVVPLRPATQGGVLTLANLRLAGLGSGGSFHPPRSRRSDQLRPSSAPPLQRLPAPAASVPLSRSVPRSPHRSLGPARLAGVLSLHSKRLPCLSRRRGDGSQGRPQ